MPGPATAATLAAVKRAWDDGSTVSVVAFRPGAADISVPVAGSLAGWRLENIRRHYGGPAQVVLGLQKGVPFCSTRPIDQAATAAGLVLALRRFKKATLLVGEDPELVPACFRAIAACAGECVVASDEARRQLEKRYRLRPGLVVVEEVEPFPSLPAGADPAFSGLYRPGAGRALTTVELPTTTVADRAATRARVARSKVMRHLKFR